LPLDELHPLMTTASEAARAVAPKTVRFTLASLRKGSAGTHPASDWFRRIEVLG
jgi:hypothetical protein